MSAVPPTLIPHTKLAEEFSWLIENLVPGATCALPVLHIYHGDGQEVVVNVPGDDNFDTMTRISIALGVVVNSLPDIKIAAIAFCSESTETSFNLDGIDVDEDQVVASYTAGGIEALTTLLGSERILQKDAAVIAYADIRDNHWTYHRSFTRADDGSVTWDADEPPLRDVQGMVNIALRTMMRAARNDKLGELGAIVSTLSDYRVVGVQRS